MNLLSRAQFLLPACAALALGLPSPAAAADETGPHPGTQAALQCLLHNAEKGCEQVFTSVAHVQALDWVLTSPWPDFNLGALDSADYARTISDSNVYDIRFLNGQRTDVYDVKFLHQEMTFYIALPEADGKIRHLVIRNGAPNDERQELFLHGPG